MSKQAGVVELGEFFAKLAKELRLAANSTKKRTICEGNTVASLVLDELGANLPSQKITTMIAA